MPYSNLREEELKNKIAQDYFCDFDCSKIIGNIDFCVTFKTEKPAGELFEIQSLLWAEAKKSTADSFNSLSQLVLTVGKARTFDKMLPPPFLAAFDSQKIAFVPYNDVQEVFYQNDFNWKVAPSDYQTTEFKQVHEKIKESVAGKSLLFRFGRDERELQDFIKNNFVVGKPGISKIRIDKNNFLVIYGKWSDTVKPTIAVNWEIAQKNGIIDGDFYLADLLSRENQTLKQKLYVILKKDQYELDRKLDEMGMFNPRRASFIDKQKAHAEFWNKYERPPKEQYWDYITKRRDLLVPQDVRERKGSFFTPRIWVELSQKYLADVLGEDWQDEYYVWDCAAGTGNLLAGLTNKYNIWASTLDRQDVDVMHDRIKNGANLLDNHVFQFDFLNDSFDKLPAGLKKIVEDPGKRKKLVIYINPPYAEATTARTVTGTAENKAGVAKGSVVNEEFKPLIGSAANELFALFMAKIYKEIPGSMLGQFSKVKFIQGSNFRKFKTYFLADYLKGFVMRADTFDNVKGRFPIGFTLWSLSGSKEMRKISCDVIENDGKKSAEKFFYGHLGESINKWLRNFYENGDIDIGTLSTRGNDFQNQKYIYLATNIDNDVHDTKVKISYVNLLPVCTYFSVRHSVKHTWLGSVEL